jgi:5-formyltetrahydrofolate cyclo-ligase
MTALQDETILEALGSSTPHSLAELIKQPGRWPKNLNIRHVVENLSDDQRQETREVAAHALRIASPHLSKAELRKRMDFLRRVNPPTHRHASGGRILEQGLEFLKGKIHEGQVLAAYLSIKGEADTLPLLEQLQKQGVRTVLPVMQEGTKLLAFREWKKGNPLTIGAFGIATPKNESATLRPDLLLVPLLACDGNGNRLGYGGGYYDTTLEALRKDKPDLTAYGVAYAFQQLSALTPESWDQPIQGLITEEGAKRFS